MSDQTYQSTGLNRPGISARQAPFSALSYHHLSILRRARRALMAGLLLAVSALVMAAPADVILVLDNSGSMRKNDPEFLLKPAVARFIEGLEAQTRVGLVIFDQSVRYPVALGDLTVQSRAAIEAALNAIDYRGQFTNSPAAIERAIYELKSSAREGAERIVIFMTDGIVDTGDAATDVEKTKWMREELATDAADNRIRMFSVAFTDNADFFLIQSLAKKTDGEYFRALTAADLDNVFASIQSKLTAPAVVTAPVPAAPLEPVPAAPTPPAPEPAATPPAPTAAADASCLEALIAEERQFMEETAVEAGIPAEQLCREMTQAPAGTAIVVRPKNPQAAEDERSAMLLVLAIAAVVLLALVVAVVWWLRRRTQGGAPEAAPSTSGRAMPEAFLKDVNGITGQVPFKIGHKPLVIGRVLGNDPGHLDYYVIDKGTVGRRHAIIQYRAFAFWLIDQGSVNGTFLNGERIEGERQIKHGDRLKFHKFEFEFAIPELEGPGHTVFADPHESTMVGDATMMGTAAMSTGALQAAMARSNIDDDAFDLTAEDDVEAVPSPAYADPEMDDESSTVMPHEVPDTNHDYVATAALTPGTSSAADYDDDFSEQETVLPSTPQPSSPVGAGHGGSASLFSDAEIAQTAEEFDAEASAFFDEDGFGQTAAPLLDDDFDEEPTVLPAAVARAPIVDDSDDEFSESETIAPGSAHANERSEAVDISLDDFMATASYGTPRAGEELDDESDVTLSPGSASPARMVDDFFDITGEGTIPPVSEHGDDEDDDDEDESPTELRP